MLLKVHYQWSFSQFYGSFFGLFLTSDFIYLTQCNCLVCHGHNTLWLFVIWMLSTPDLHGAATKTKYFKCTTVVSVLQPRREKTPLSEIRRVRTVFRCRACRGNLVAELQMTRCMFIITTSLASEIAGLSTIRQEEALYQVYYFPARQKSAKLQVATADLTRKKISI